MKPIILSFNVEGERLDMLKKAAGSTDTEVRPIPASRFGQSLFSLIGDEKGYSSPLLRSFTGEMLVFVSVPEAAFSLILDALKATLKPNIALKAVLTPTNAMWSAIELYGELVKEREAILNAKKPRG